MRSAVTSLAIITSALLICSCSLRPVRKAKRLTYDVSHDLKLNVFSPLKRKEKREVMVFIHGGNWVNGTRSLYNFFGKGLARKGMVGVVISYRLSPKTNYVGMANDAAKAVKWVKENISKYGGDPDKIYLSGHSAGAHLAALIADDDRYFDTLGIQNPVKGVVLIDAFGLNMDTYLAQVGGKANPVHIDVFSKDTLAWKNGSPINYLDKKSPPYIVFVGEKTYPAIKNGSDQFLKEVKKYRPETKIVYFKRKRHATMIFNYINPFNKGYGEIIGFIRK